MNNTAKFVEENAEDLRILGLLFCRLLQADMYVLSTKPSATLACVMTLSSTGKLGTVKSMGQLINELTSTGDPLLTDGSGGSILRS
ncbi:hypothetical protein L6270_03430 [Candidatus Parcubacteria bacterium]|nr:hypothetical protein [Patescibacteria group bacterium]MBU4309015.1 hypothetical protein [Patescibacteria group bacterium]MBU4432390.1 hypothetical protein [Patescibacteria group bacterium]MBU4577376.1 hypothetical protein [Patescibacteria group bacterium]MCG2697064.1 hypothetical protein [Candidatus Parcubacteria bacterium]